MYATYGTLGLVASANLSMWPPVELSMYYGYHVQTAYSGSTLHKHRTNSLQCHPNVRKITELTPNLGHLQQAKGLSRVGHTSVRHAMFGILMTNNILLWEEES